MKTKSTLLILLLLSLLFYSCSSDDDNFGLENYLFSMGLTTDDGDATTINTNIRIGVNLSDMKTNKANYVTRVYTSAPSISKITLNNAEVLSTDKTNHNYNNENTLFFKFSASKSGIYVVTIEVENEKHKEQKAVSIIVMANYEVVISHNSDEGTVTGAKIYQEGETAVLTATPAHGYVFDGWYVDNQLVSNDKNYTIIVEKSIVLVARFKKDTFSVFLNPTNNCTVTGAGNYLFQEEVAISTTHPRKYYGFAGWYEGNTKVSDDLVYRFNIEKNVTYTAKWENRGLDVVAVMFKGAAYTIINNPQNNGGYVFVSFQWYREGIAMQGFTGQYLGFPDMKLPYYQEYFCEMVTDLGETVYSLPFIPKPY